MAEPRPIAGELLALASMYLFAALAALAGAALIPS